MALSIGKMAPTAIVVAAVGYCCWPYLSPSGPGIVPEESRPAAEINNSLLSPKITVAPGRDPFGMKLALPDDDKTDSADSQAVVKAATPTVAAGANKGAPNTTTVAAVPNKDATVNHQSEVHSPTGAADTDKEQPLSSLSLNATFLRGTRRVAMINSQFYSEGESLESSEANTKPFVVSKIFQHRVVLERHGRTVELTYPEAPPRVEAESPNPVAGRVQRPVTPKVVSTES